MSVKLGTLLVREGIVTPAQLEEALKIQVLYGGRLGTSLVELGYLDPDVLAQCLGRTSGFPPVTTQMLEEAPYETLRLIPADLASKYECLPFKRENRQLFVAMVNPADLAAADALSFKTGLRIKPHVVPESQLHAYLEKRYGVERAERYIRIKGSAPVQLPPGIKREQPRQAPPTQGTDLMSGYLSRPASPVSVSPSASVAAMPSRAPAVAGVPSMPAVTSPTMPAVSTPPWPAGSPSSPSRAPASRAPASVPAAPAAAVSTPPWPATPPAATDPFTPISRAPMAAAPTTAPPAADPAVTPQWTVPLGMTPDPSALPGWGMAPAPNGRPPADAPSPTDPHPSWSRPPTAPAVAEAGTDAPVAAPLRVPEPTLPPTGWASSATPPEAPTVPPDESYVPEPTLPPLTSLPPTPAVETPLSISADTEAATRPVAAPPRMTLVQAHAALAAARDRDDLAEAVLQYTVGRLDAGVLLLVRDKTLVGWKGRGEGLEAASVEQIHLQLDSPSIFLEAITQRHPTGGEAVNGNLPTQFLDILHRNQPASVVVVPVVLRNRTVNLIYADRLDRPDALDAVDSLVELADQLAAAYERIVRENRRRA